LAALNFGFLAALGLGAIRDHTSDTRMRSMPMPLSVCNVAATCDGDE
jgi:hypothetical protein